MLEKLKSIDGYGHPVSVLYKGGTTHNTVFGSVFTLLTSALVLIFATSRLIEMMHHTDQSITSRAAYDDIDKEGKIYLKDKNFTLAFQIIAFDANFQIDHNFRAPPEIGRWIANMQTINFDGDNFSVKSVNVPILTIDEYPSFLGDFGVNEDQKNTFFRYMRPQYILDLSGTYLEKSSIMSQGFTTLDV